MILVVYRKGMDDRIDMIEAAESRPEAMCLFIQGGKPFAVSLRSVVEVVRVDRLVRLPLGPPELIGLCTLRRNVIPVFRPDFDGATENLFSDVESLVLVLSVERGNFGLMIDRQGVQVDEGLTDTDRGPGSVEQTSSSVFRRQGVNHVRFDPDRAWERYRERCGEWFREKSTGT